MTSFCFPPRRLLLFSLSLVLYIGHRSFSSSRGVPGTEPYLVPRFNGRQLASQARPDRPQEPEEPRESIPRNQVSVSPSVSPCLDCVCGAPIDRILTTIIMIKKAIIISVLMTTTPTSRRRWWCCWSRWWWWIWWNWCGPQWITATFCDNISKLEQILNRVSRRPS